jgi:hypothetical protein
MKIRPVRAELFHADGRTDRQTKLIVAFRNFANAPKNVVKFSYVLTAVIDCHRAILTVTALKNVSLYLT